MVILYDQTMDALYMEDEGDVIFFDTLKLLAKMTGHATISDLSESIGFSRVTVYHLFNTNKEHLASLVNLSLL